MATIGDVLICLVGHLVIRGDGAITMVRFNVDSTFVTGRTGRSTMFASVRRMSVIHEMFLLFRQLRHVSRIDKQWVGSKRSSCINENQILLFFKGRCWITQAYATSAIAGQ